MQKIRARSDSQGNIREDMPVGNQEGLRYQKTGSKPLSNDVRINRAHNPRNCAPGLSPCIAGRGRQVIKRRPYFSLDEERKLAALTKAFGLPKHSLASSKACLSHGAVGG